VPRFAPELREDVRVPIGRVQVVELVRATVVALVALDGDVTRQDGPVLLRQGLNEGSERLFIYTLWPEIKAFQASVSTGSWWMCVPVPFWLAITHW